MKFRINTQINSLTNSVIQELSDVFKIPKGKILDLIIMGDDFSDVYFVFEIQYPINPNNKNVMALPHYRAKVVQGLTGIKELVNNETENFQLISCYFDFSEAQAIVNQY